MKDKRKAEDSSALLSKNGYLRLSSDLVPKDARKKKMEMVVAPLPNKTLLLREATSKDKKEGLAVRRLMWANKAAKCPMIAIRSALKFLGVKVPSESVHYEVDRRKNGELTVKF
jgi:hypothetical protein